MLTLATPLLLCCSLVVVACTSSKSQVACYDGPAGTQGVGECRAGARICPDEGSCSATCAGQVLPSDEICDGKDNDCDGVVDEGLLNPCGGCSSLAGVPGGPCGQCGALYCDSIDHLTCAPTASTIGHACVADDGCPGTFVCNGVSTRCQPTLKADACGFCSKTPKQGVMGQTCSDEPGCTGTLACNPDGSGITCLGGSHNECGVCDLPLRYLGGSCEAGVVPAGGVGLLPNGSFEDDIDANGVPDCWQRSDNGQRVLWANGVPHTGRRAASVTVSAAGDSLSIQTLQNDLCASALTLDHDYQVTAWYISTAEVTLFLSYRDGEGNWYEWAESSSFSPVEQYSLASWRVRDLSPDARKIGIGIRIASPGTLTVDDFNISDLSLKP